jgi:gluconokinase
MSSKVFIQNPKLIDPTGKLDSSLKIRFLIIMGVTGSGKTTIGEALADRLGWDFYDADDFHSSTNIIKMTKGIPLTDEDRLPWLLLLRSKITDCLENGHPGILACSALKASYRQILLSNNTEIQIVYLKASFDLVLSRLTTRTDHFMQPSMLQSQFDTLEEPKNAIFVDIRSSVDIIVDKIITTLDESTQYR